MTGDHNDFRGVMSIEHNMFTLSTEQTERKNTNKIRGWKKLFNKIEHFCLTIINSKTDSDKCR